jgi:Fe-S oxidoreductase
MRHTPEFAPRALAGRKAMLHLHCHHRAVMKPDDELALLDKLGVDAQVAEPGCCGMAGPFGFRRGVPYDVSVSCAGRRLIPAVRAAAEDVLLIADGYSCREQIAQLAGREALHLAEVLAMAQEAHHE